MESNNLLTLKKRAEEKYKRDRDTFLQNRAVQESSINLFIERLLQLPDDFRKRLGIDESTNYRTFFPSLFQDVLDEEQYKIEMQNYRLFESKARAIESEVNANAVKVLEDYVG